MPECKHTEGPQHDCAYVDFRNACSERAAVLADMTHGSVLPAPDTEDENGMRWAQRWNRLYIAELARLVSRA